MSQYHTGLTCQHPCDTALWGGYSNEAQGESSLLSSHRIFTFLPKSLVGMEIIRIFANGIKQLKYGSYCIKSDTNALIEALCLQ